MHKRANRVGLNPAYLIKDPTIKVELQNIRKIENDKYKIIITNILNLFIDT